MPWFRLDDSFHSHPKILDAGNEAIGLWVRCGTYAAQHLTDGYIPEELANLYGASQVRSRGDAGPSKTETLAETLVRTKLWRRTRGGWRMPDYLDYNPSAQAVDNDRRMKAERQKRWRETHGRRVTNPSGDASRNALQDGAPPRPAPKEAGRAGPAPSAGANGQPNPPGPAARTRRPEDRTVAQAITEATTPGARQP